MYQRTDKGERVHFFVWVRSIDDSLDPIQQTDEMALMPKIPTRAATESQMSATPTG
jgi:hypothetical protein